VQVNSEVVGPGTDQPHRSCFQPAGQQPVHVIGFRHFFRRKERHQIGELNAGEWGAIIRKFA
jgi:hypothetical protein